MCPLASLQLSELTQLADLRVYGHTHEPEPKLDALTALRFLHFSMVYTLPASLALLTGLQALSITTGRFGPEQLVGLTEPQVDAMLQRLPHLTCLVSAGGGRRGGRPAVSCLSTQRRKAGSRNAASLGHTCAGVLR